MAVIGSRTYPNVSDLNQFSYLIVARLLPSSIYLFQRGQVEPSRPSGQRAAEENQRVGGQTAGSVAHQPGALVSGQRDLRTRGEQLTCPVQVSRSVQRRPLVSVNCVNDLAR